MLESMGIATGSKILQLINSVLYQRKKAEDVTCCTAHGQLWCILRVWEGAQIRADPITPLQQVCVIFVPHSLTYFKLTAYLI